MYRAFDRSGTSTDEGVMSNIRLSLRRLFPDSLKPLSPFSSDLCIDDREIEAKETLRIKRFLDVADELFLHPTGNGENDYPLKSSVSDNLDISLLC
ncbi:hypothetical protein ElyMa_003072000 [Elysia marginata]|uniref:PX domain-containing protein n=1 Tax=Elysia marginata TaxID=1093978 RepID=A0AAV4IN76_9GAST|nr:hypothetical protein ElyMa_003072000 [Elysia marginata]